MPNGGYVLRASEDATFLFESELIPQQKSRPIYSGHVLRIKKALYSLIPAGPVSTLLYVAGSLNCSSFHFVCWHTMNHWRRGYFLQILLHTFYRTSPFLADAR